MDKGGGFVHEMMEGTGELKSLSLFVGTGNCNANCVHCAGKIHRKYAPKEDGIIDEDLIRKTVRECYIKGARSLSISSSGEPTLSPLSVTKALKLIHDLRNEGVNYSRINLYSNGIVIGKDKNFCDKYLGLWKSLGLTTIYLTIHDTDEKNNASVYGIVDYPPLTKIISKIHDSGLKVRGNTVLSKKLISNLDEFVEMIKKLEVLKVDYISAWPIRNENDEVDAEMAPSKEELSKISAWIEKDNHYGFEVKLLGDETHALYAENKKLTLFPDNTLSNSWCNH